MEVDLEYMMESRSVPTLGKLLGIKKALCLEKSLEIDLENMMESLLVPTLG